PCSLPGTSSVIKKHITTFSDFVNDLVSFFRRQAIRRPRLGSLAAKSDEGGDELSPPGAKPSFGFAPPTKSAFDIFPDQPLRRNPFFRRSGAHRLEQTAGQPEVD